MKVLLPLILSFLLLNVLPAFADDGRADQKLSGEESWLALPLVPNFGNTLAFGMAVGGDRSGEEKPEILSLQTERTEPLGRFLPLWPVSEAAPVRLLEPWLTDQTPPVRLLEPWIISEEAVAAVDNEVEPE
jgi:hypothetical protein